MSSSQLHVDHMVSRSLKKVPRLLKANCGLKKMIWKFCWLHKSGSTNVVQDNRSGRRDVTDLLRIFDYVEYCPGQTKTDLPMETVIHPQEKHYVANGVVFGLNGEEYFDYWIKTMELKHMSRLKL